MQHIDQNMDDLFRKAAADYPLKLNESQWDDIAPMVVQGQVNNPVSNKTISKKYIGLLVIFLSLLLTAGLITNIFKPIKQNNLLSPAAENKTNKTGITNETADNTKDKITGKKQAQQKHYTGQSTLPSLTDYSSLTLKKERIQKQTTGTESFETKSDPSSENIVGNTNPLAKNTIETNNSIAPVIKQETIAESDKTEPAKDSNSQKEDQVIAENNIAKKIPLRQTGMYLGAAAGPLFDEVKNQGLKKTGFSAGIIAGYQFKNHLSVETGLLYAKKPYFSTGKYFSMDKISNAMPAGMEILSLEGNNYVLEIPVKIKYDFLHRNKRNFFLSAGFTSYIKTNEKNNYLVLLNGVQQSMVSYYKNKSRSLAATFDISVGYEHKISKWNRIRIEPYLQIPLKGMGVGSMPMISTGFRIGLTKFTN
jgi:hypothetical protein